MKYIRRIGPQKIENQCRLHSDQNNNYRFAKLSSTEMLALSILRGASTPEFSHPCLEALNADKIGWYGYEAKTLRLASDVRYTPDFCVLIKRGERILEVYIEAKGPRFWDDAKVKIQVAASCYPCHEFWLWRQTQSRGPLEPILIKSSPLSAEQALDSFFQ